jgi:hypothetical protein
VASDVERTAGLEAVFRTYGHVELLPPSSLVGPVKLLRTTGYLKEPKPWRAKPTAWRW